MKILIATTAFPRWKGDFRGIFVFEPARILAIKGWQVRVLAMHNPGSQHFEVLDHIEIFRPKYAPLRWEILQKDSAGIPASWKSNPLSRVLLLPFLVIHTINMIRHARDVDIIHANWTLSGICGLLSSLLYRKKLLITVQGSDIFQAGKIPIIRFITKMALKRSDRIIALSKSLAHETSQLAQIPLNKISVIPNGVDISRFNFSPPASREKILLFVGSLIERKGGHILIEAFYNILKKFPDYQLIMIGEGNQHNNLQNLIQRKNLTGKVTLIGVQSQTEVGNWMSKAKLFIFPSLEEGQGVVLVEALASGLPCIGSDVGGIPDVIDPAVGRLVPPGDPIELAEVICDILGNQADWESMCYAARKRAEKLYDWNHIADQLIELYNSVRENAKTHS